MKREGRREGKRVPRWTTLKIQCKNGINDSNIVNSSPCIEAEKAIKYIILKI